MNKDPKYVPHELQIDKEMQTAEGKRMEKYVGHLLKEVQTDTPSTLEERWHSYWKEHHGLVSYEPTLGFIKQELQRFASEVEKIIEEVASLDWVERERRIKALKTRYGLMEGEKV